MTMVAFLFLGIFASMAHHFYYASRDGKRVGNDREQQWALRSGLSFVDFLQPSVTYILVILPTRHTDITFTGGERHWPSSRKLAL